MLLERQTSWEEGTLGEIVGQLWYCHWIHSCSCSILKSFTVVPRLDDLTSKPCRSWLELLQSSKKHVMLGYCASIGIGCLFTPAMGDLRFKQHLTRPCNCGYRLIVCRASSRKTGLNTSLYPSINMLQKATFLLLSTPLQQEWRPPQ